MAIRRIIKFATIGTLGFAIDSAILTLMISAFGMNPYAARVISYLISATTTWAGNRLLTFSDRPRTEPLRQWLSFLTASLIGFAINYAVYALLVSQVQFCMNYPVTAVAIATLVTMLFNFFSYSRFVFAGSKTT